MNSESHGWKPGPLPPDTWNWGGVVLHEDRSRGGFHLCNFCGDHVLLFELGKQPGDFRRAEAWEVQAFNNSLGPVPRELLHDV